jgi:hypothetical protein
MPNLIRPFLLASCTTLAASSFAAPAETLCSDHPQLLARREGVYADRRFVDAYAPPVAGTWGKPTHPRRS